MDKYFYLVILALLSSLLLYVFIPDPQDAGTFASYEGVALSDVSGQTFKLTGQFTEKPILFVFWSVTCGTCIEEIPFVSNLHKELSNKVTVIGIHPPGLPIKKIQKFVKRYKPAIPYMLAIDLDKNLMKTHSITVLPRIVLVNRHGKVLYDHLGYAQDKEGEVKNAISALL